MDRVPVVIRKVGDERRINFMTFFNKMEREIWHRLMSKSTITMYTSKTETIFIRK